MENELKYKVGDRILFEAVISEIDVDDMEAPYYLSFEDVSGRWANEEELDALSDKLPPRRKVTQAVVVPAFIDSYIRYAKIEGMSLFIAMANAQNKETEWIITNEETFARAWLDGYNIEKQKYIVEIPNPESEGKKRFYLGYNDVGKIVIVQRKQVQNFSPLSLTEKEIKRSHAWAWEAGLAKPVEEVE